ncbi:MAG: hypothetical protein ACKV2U_03875 [Bryobacteraceae bacterium]
MFTWICPQCGGEVLPSQEECPRCAKVVAPQPAAAVQPPARPAAPPAQMPIAPPAPPAPVYTAPAAPVYSPPALSYAPPPEPRSTGIRDLLVTVGVAVALLGVGYLVWTKDDGAEKNAAATKAAMEMESVKSAQSTHPLAKYVEVTGIRLRLPRAGQAEVQLVVVNHSAAEIADLSMDVVVGGRGSSKDVAAFPVKVKRLSPFGSAEVSAKAKTGMSAMDLPDWQFLEARVVIQANEP